MKTPRPPDAVLARHLRAIRRHLDAAVEGDTPAIHRVRVATRRLREALPLATGTGHDRAARKAGRAARRLARGFSRVREIDVSRALLDELAREATAQIGGALAGQRRKALRRARRRAAALSMDRLIARVRRLRGALKHGEGWREPLARRVLSRARTLSAALDAAGHAYAAEPLHDVRVAIKKLRYALELAGEVSGAPAAQAVAALRDVQRLLGRVNDCEIVLVDVRALRADTTDTRAARALQSIDDGLVSEARTGHAAFVAAIPALRAIVKEVPAIAAHITGAPRMVKASSEDVRALQEAG